MSNIVHYASSFIGVKQGTRRHKLIVDRYNQITPLPRGYKVSYKDNWCATFVSFVLYSCGLKKDLFECGANRMRDKFKGLDAEKPKAGDIIFYDWDCNGWSDHVGIIRDVSKASYTVIEGNKQKQVGVRVISKKSKSIQMIAHIPSKYFK